MHFREPSYGVRRINVELCNLGINAGRKLIRRYMEEMCIIAFYPGPNLSKRDLAKRTFPYLLRNFKTRATNQVWGIDITCCGTPAGYVYLVAIIDWHSRYLIGYSISNTMHSEFVIRAIEDAVMKHGLPKVMNSDQGSQFTSMAYIDLLKRLDIKISMNGKGRATDNAITERFFRNIKWERLYLECPETVPELKKVVNQYIAHYNYDRPHQALGYEFPAAVHHLNKECVEAA